LGSCGLVLWYELVTELVSDVLAGTQSSGFESVFVDFDALVNVGLTMADETVNEGGKSAGQDEDGDAGAFAPRRQRAD